MRCHIGVRCQRFPTRSGSRSSGVACVDYRDEGGIAPSSKRAPTTLEREGNKKQWHDPRVDGVAARVNQGRADTMVARHSISRVPLTMSRRENPTRSGVRREGGVADERPAHPSEKEARQSREMPLGGGARRSYPPRLRRGCEWREGPYRRFKHAAQKWRPCDERALRSARTPARTTRKI